MALCTRLPGCHSHTVLGCHGLHHLLHGHRNEPGPRPETQDVRPFAGAFLLLLQRNSGWVPHQPRHERLKQNCGHACLEPRQHALGVLLSHLCPCFHAAAQLEAGCRRRAGGTGGRAADGLFSEPYTVLEPPRTQAVFSCHRLLQRGYNRSKDLKNTRDRGR